jgi:hypothetical protein
MRSCALLFKSIFVNHRCVLFGRLMLIEHSLSFVQLIVDVFQGDK